MTNNTLSCDADTGACSTARHGSAITVTVVTDPLCSACWALEPAWRRFMYHHGRQLTVRHVYGVLLPGWAGFADPAAGIAGPQDVAGHWQEVARQSGQPINASVWHTDPVSSTVPAAAALLRVRELAPTAETAYLRRLRELVLAEGRNIARGSELAAAARDVGIAADLADAVAAPPDEAALAALSKDRQRMRALGAVSFPTLVFDAAGQRLTLTGAQPYRRLRGILVALADDVAESGEPAASARRDLPAAVTLALAAYRRATTREVAELLDVDDQVAEVALAAVADRPPGALLWQLRPQVS